MAYENYGHRSYINIYERMNEVISWLLRIRGGCVHRTVRYKTRNMAVYLFDCRRVMIMWRGDER